MNIEEIKKILDELKASPKRSLGQNFLVSPQVVHKIIRRVEKEDLKEMVEVGPGLGALTLPLSEMCKATEKTLRLIELDQKFSQRWREKGFEVHEGDALKVNWSDFGFQQAALVSNLPYQISSSLVIDRSVQPFGIEFMILMFQKEVAQRIRARFGSKEYGLLSVIAQVFWEIDFVLEAGPKDFYPPPKIASRVLSFQKRKNVDLGEPKKFLSFVKAAFSQRRKLMIKNLGSYGGVSKESWIKAFKEVGLDEKIRSEALSPQQFVELYTVIS